MNLHLPLDSFLGPRKGTGCHLSLLLLEELKFPTLCVTKQELEKRIKAEVSGSTVVTVVREALRLRSQPSCFSTPLTLARGFPGAVVVNARDAGSVPGLGRSPGGGHGNPLQYSCLENPVNREAWRATIHGVTHTHTNACAHGLQSMGPQRVGHD